jgi:uncharacterized repeat protein (TIGR03803 family)
LDEPAFALLVETAHDIRVIAMLHMSDLARKGLLGCGAALAAVLPHQSACAQSYTIVYSFQGVGNGDGAQPQSSLTADEQGNLYGTTLEGGNTSCGQTLGCGTAFELSAGGTETVLHSFCSESDCEDGAVPYAGLTLDRDGNLYGTTYGTVGRAPGKNNCAKGCQHGNVFSLNQTSEQSIYSFNGNNGTNPDAPLLLRGDLFYGTTYFGGKHRGGIVFTLTRNGKENMLHDFGSGSDGSNPTGQLAADQSGDIYGTTYFGGAGGTVFELASDGTETVLYHFCSQKNCSDGQYPYGGLIADQAGNLYGTTEGGGAYGEGTVFELAPNGKSWTETVLYSFCPQSDCADGNNPDAALIMDKKGDLYGTTLLGGTNCSQTNGCGTAFELAPDGTETVLHSFAGGTTDGELPVGGLIREKGYIYGTTTYGGANGFGIVFKISLQGE